MLYEVITVLGFQTKPGLSYLAHFIPAMTVFASIITVNTMNHTSVEFFRISSAAYPNYNMHFLIRGFDFISNFYMILYFIAVV